MKHLTEKLLQEYITSEKSYARGVGYFQEGVVILDRFDEKSAQGRVAGTQVYRVALNTIKTNELSGDCSCPAFQDYGPCKHLAALGLVALAMLENGYAPSEECVERIERQEKFRETLASMDKTELIDLILQHLGDDEYLYWDLCEADDVYEL